MDCLLTVIVPNLNGARFLLETTASLRRQTMKDFVCLILDGGSADNSEEIIASLNDPRFIWVSKPELGLADRQNFAIEQCTTTYLARHDADDLSAPDRFEKQVAFLESHPEYVGVFTYYTKFGSKRSYSNADKQKSPQGSFRDYDPEKDGCHLISSMMLRSSVAKELGGFRQEYYPADDLDWEYRLAEYGPVAILEESLMKYRFSETSTSMEAQIEMLRKERWTIDSRVRRLKKLPEISYADFCKNEMADPRQAARLLRKAKTRKFIREAGCCYLNGQDIRAVACMACAFALNPKKPVERIARMVRNKIACIWR